MKFLVARKDGIKCSGCPGYIERGDEMVQNFYKKGKNITVLCFHVVCYMNWFTDMFNRKWADWKNGVGNIPPPPKRGRPVIYNQPDLHTKLNRLRSSLSYHKKLGHEVRVEMIQGKIKRVLSKG
jgi:hypothetical protein